MKKILILGANGFIGHHLTKKILETTDWEVYALDIRDDRLAGFLGHPRLRFFRGDITKDKEWVEAHIQKCDVVIPLVAIATPSVYVKQPLRVFELDFEANLPIVRWAAQYGKHLVFPSTSEVYGLCGDAEFDAANSPLVYGPIHKTRWIYACSKQLMDRVIWGYGMEGLRFTIFRPFNWIGSGLDSVDAGEKGSSRAMTQFFGHILRGENITLVDGGLQKRTFTFIEDGIDALMRIIANKNGNACGKIYNIGNPGNHHSIAELAGMMLDMAKTYPEYKANADKVRFEECTGQEYYGEGYEDVPNRVPNIGNLCEELGWYPQVSMQAGLRCIYDDYLANVAKVHTTAG